MTPERPDMDGKWTEEKCGVGGHYVWCKCHKTGVPEPNAVRCMKSQLGCKSERDKSKKLAAHVRELRASVGLCLTWMEHGNERNLPEVLRWAHTSIDEAEKYLREVGEL